MRNPRRTPDGPDHPPAIPPAATRAVTLIVLTAGPLLAIAAAVAGDPRLAGLAARVCRAALELTAAVGLIAALHGR